MSKQPRHNDTKLVIGKRKSGKSHFSRNTLLKPYIEMGRKVLVLHRSPHPDYDYMQPLAASQLKAWCRDKKLVGPRYCYHPNTDKLIDTVNDNFDQTGEKSGVILLEDFTSWHTGRMSKRLLAMFTDQTQRNYDVIAQCHGIGLVPKQMFQLTKWIILFKSEFNASNERSRLNPYLFEQVQKAHKELKKYQLTDYQYKVILNE